MFVKLIRKIKKANNLTTQELSDISGVNRRTIEGWLLGRTPDKFAWKIFIYNFESSK